MPTLTTSLVNIFETLSNPRISALKTKLVAYHRLLVSSRLSNAALVDLPLPKSLDPARKIDLPSRFLPLWILTKDTTACLLRLPFFLVPLVLYAPVYAAGVLGSRLAEDEQETQAQTKIALSLLLSFLIYPILFFFLWTIFAAVPLGAAFAIGVIWLLRRYHSSLIDENYTA